MSSPTVVHISPFPITESRQAELARLFGEPVEVIELSHRDYRPWFASDSTTEPAEVCLRRYRDNFGRLLVLPTATARIFNST